MAGSVIPGIIPHRSRGVVRTDIAITCDASGAASETEVGVGFGRLVGVVLDVNSLDFGSCILTVKDKKSGASVLAFDSLNLISAADIFGNTTTGDTTGGAAEDIWTTGAAHGLVASDAIIFTAIAGNGAGGPTVGVKYYVVTGASLTGSTFCLSDSVAHAVAGTNIVNVGATDATSSSWFKVGSASAVARFYRPTQVIVDNGGASVTAATSAPNVNRAIYLGGKVSLVVAEGGNLGGGVLSLIVDESGVGDLARTV